MQLIKKNFRELLSEMDEMDYEEVTELLHVWYEQCSGNADI